MGKNEGGTVLQQKQKVRELYGSRVEDNDMAVLYELLEQNRRICSANGGLPPAVKRKMYYKSHVSAA